MKRTVLTAVITCILSAHALASETPGDCFRRPPPYEGYCEDETTHQARINKAFESPNIKAIAVVASGPLGRGGGPHYIQRHLTKAMPTGYSVYLAVDEEEAHRLAFWGVLYVNWDQTVHEAGWVIRKRTDRTLFLRLVPRDEHVTTNWKEVKLTGSTVPGPSNNALHFQETDEWESLPTLEVYEQ